MSSDRWRQAEDLCHAALTYRADERRSFLANACQGDEALLREVESLLAQESSADGFMSVPAAALAGSAGLNELRGTLVGARFGSYTIRSLLGIGGMGEVYRAHGGTAHTGEGDARAPPGAQLQGRVKPRKPFEDQSEVSASSKNSCSSAILLISQSEYITSPTTNRHNPSASSATTAVKSTSTSSPWT